MNRFLRMLLLVAWPVLIPVGALAGDYDNREQVWARVIDVMEIPGTGKIITTIGVEVNEHQICACQVIGVRVRCMCEMPRQGLCLETES